MLEWFNSLLQNLEPENLTQLAGQLIEFILLSLVFFFISKYLVASLLAGWIRAIKNPEWKEQIAVTKQRIHGFSYLSIAILMTYSFLERERSLIIFLSLTGVILLQLLVIMTSWIRFLVANAQVFKTQDGRLQVFSQNLSTVLIIFVWLIGIVAWLDNFGFNVTTLIAGLGIGGIAVGLASQAILSDIFSSFTIALDKPFEAGDFVVVDDFKGTVENVGLKSTRIQSLSGEVIVFPNRHLVDSRVRNFKQMKERRVVFSLGVTYDIEPSLLEKLPHVLSQIVGSQDEVRFDRAHFARFDDFSLTLEVVYFVLNSDYTRYMDIQEKINFEILKQFNALGVSFAFPTTTIDLPARVEDLKS